jgi:hypothetical protein
LIYSIEYLSFPFLILTNIDEEQDGEEISTIDQTDIRGLDTAGQWDRRELAFV